MLGRLSWSSALHIVFGEVIYFTFLTSHFTLSKMDKSILDYASMEIDVFGRELQGRQFPFSGTMSVS